jgi:hypothetical protein
MQLNRQAGNYESQIGKGKMEYWMGGIMDGWSVGRLARTQNLLTAALAAPNSFGTKH